MAKRGKITIVEKLCKGCAICVRFCPKQVLEMKKFKVHIKSADACIACAMCELRCPDFAISVEAEQ
ncbi:4Fe-4S binding protein [Deferribacterales bacterium RsTz2092]